MRYLIDFFNTATNNEIDQYLAVNGCNKLKEWNNFEKVFLIETDSIPPKTGIVERLEEENIVALKPHNTVEIDPYFGCHQNPKYPAMDIQIHDEKDWWKNFSYAQPKFEGDTLTLRRLGKNIDVYVMDSGIEESHPEFENAEIVKLYSVTGTDFSDNNGHGTAMAAVISGKTCGITDAVIKVVKIFDANHNTRQSEFLDALDAVIEDHTENTFAVINASWSIPKNEYIEHKLRIAIAEGIYVIAAAGNNGSSIEDVTPASMMEVLTVGAYNQNLEPCDFSNYTSTTISTFADQCNHGELDGWAPGDKIWTACLGGGYGYASGTSMAAAISSAVLVSNLGWKADEQGNRHPVYESLEISTLSYESIWATMNVFARPDLLDFTDPKYSNSKNLVATIYDYCLKNNIQPPNELSLMLRVGDFTPIKILEPSVTKNITWLTPLPDGWHLDGPGQLYINPVAEQGPDLDQHYKLHELKFLRTDLEDQSEEVTLKIYVLDKNKDVATIPPDDPIIPITLLVNCAGIGCTSGTASACLDVCAYGCCAGYKSFFLKCKCDNMTL